MFLALKLHLTTDYNFIQYNGKLSGGKASPQSRALAARLQTEENCLEFFIANFVDRFMNDNGVVSFIGEFSNKPSFEIWHKFQRLKDQKNINLEKDIEYLYPNFHQLKDLSFVLRQIYDKKVSIISILILTKKLKLYDKWETEDDPFLSGMKFFLRKMSSFFEVPNEKITSAVASAKQKAINSVSLCEGD